MTVRIFEIESADSGGSFIGGRNSLWAGGSMSYFVGAKMLIRFIHVTNDDGDVLKPAIVTT